MELLLSLEVLIVLLCASTSVSHATSSYCSYNGDYWGHRCHCSPAWSGSKCQYAVKTCGYSSTGLTVHCVHGVCGEHWYSSSRHYWTCDCSAGWTGDTCESWEGQTTPTTTTTRTTITTRSTTTSHRVTHHSHHHTTPTSAKECGPAQHHSTMYCVHGVCVEHQNFGSTFDHYYTCHCYGDWTDTHCDVYNGEATQAPTTSPATTTTPETTTITIRYSGCDGPVALVDVAKHLNTSNPYAVKCPSGSHESHEAFVLNYCNTVSKDTSIWQPGANVGTSCDSIPQYTAVASFESGVYSPRTSVSGILMKCLPNGFEIGVKRCDHGTRLEIFTNHGSYPHHANSFYTVQSL